MTTLDRDARAVLNAAADTALHHHLGGHPARACSAVAVAADYGPPGMHHVMRRWADLLVAQAPRPNTPATLVRLEFVDHDGTHMPTGDVDPHTVWAGRWIAALVARDHQTADALLALDQPPELLLARTLAVLHITTATLILPAAA